MPDNAVHAFWSERQGNERCERVHRVIDSFASVAGASHRRWFHDPLSAMVVADTVEGSQCRQAALNHLLVDQLYGSPETKIVMEMIRLSEAEPRCRVRRA